MGTMEWRRLAWFVVLMALLLGSATAQKPVKNAQAEQTLFGTELVPDEPFMDNPVEIPVGALQVIIDNLHRGAVNCLNAHKISPDRLPPLWFAASEIHLDGPQEISLVVQPNLPKIVAHEVPLKEGAGCLLGANLGPFWVLRKNRSGRYDLLLATYALGLKVLDSRTNGYRDIEIGAATAITATTVVYKMAAGQYQVAEKKTEP